MDNEQYLLLLLADANLPTGSFVASSGLESYAKHGFLPNSNSGEKVMDFVRSSLDVYARSSLPFVLDAHEVVEHVEDVERAKSKIQELDALCEAMTLNHVARRASKAQGVALLTLFTKGFTRPAWLGSSGSDSRWDTVTSLVDALKLDVRREDTPGHLAVCWGVLTAALGLSSGRSTPNCIPTILTNIPQNAVNTSTSFSTPAPSSPPPSA